MKKIASMVGVGAMVLSLGLGSAFAQQATSTTTPPVASEKDKAPVAVPEMKKADPIKATGSEVKSGVEAKSEKAAVEMKKAADPVKGEIDKAATVKPDVDKATDAKSAVEKKDGKVDAAKPADAVKKLDEAKSVKQ